LDICFNSGTVIQAFMRGGIFRGLLLLRDGMLWSGRLTAKKSWGYIGTLVKIAKTDRRIGTQCYGQIGALEKV
jgi:hypothetical protein